MTFNMLLSRVPSYFTILAFIYIEEWYMGDCHCTDFFGGILSIRTKYCSVN